MKRLPIYTPDPVVARGQLGEAREIDRKTRPIYVIWEVTLACNLSCIHCGSRADRARKNELDTAECLDVVDQLAELGVREVILIGGEIYLRRDHLEIIARSKARGMETLMTTGGRGLSRARADAMADAGLVSASVSVDGVSATHDAIRGHGGSHAAAIEALANLRAAGINVSVNTQINRASLPELEMIYDAVVAAGAHSWQIQLTVPMGRAADHPELILQPADLLDLFPRLGALKSRCDADDVVLWTGNNVGYFGPFETALRGMLPRGHGGSCGAACVGFGIESDGTVKGCPSLATATWGAGTLREAPLATLWERSGRMQYNRSRTVDDLWGFCRECYYASTCLGGCTWTAESLLGRPGNNPLCHHRALERERAGLREHLVPVASAPGEPFDMGCFELRLEPISEST